MVNNNGFDKASIINSIKSNPSMATNSPGGFDKNAILDRINNPQNYIAPDVPQPTQQPIQPAPKQSLLQKLGQGTENLLKHPVDTIGNFGLNTGTGHVLEYLLAPHNEKVLQQAQQKNEAIQKGTIQTITNRINTETDPNKKIKLQQILNNYTQSISKDKLDTKDVPGAKDTKAQKWANIGLSILELGTLGIGTGAAEGAAEVGGKTMLSKLVSGGAKEVLPKIVKGAATGYGFDTLGKVSQGETNIKKIAKPGLNTALFPIAEVGGEAALKGVSNLVRGSKGLIKGGEDVAGEVAAKAADIKPEPPKESPLHIEAKKYKSADEFIKAQGEPLYHGTGEGVNFNEFDSSLAQKGNRGSQVHLTESQAAADWFSKLKSQTNFMKTDEFRNGSNNGAIGDFKPNTKEFIVPKDAKIKVLKTLPQQGAENVINRLKKEGYDGVRFTDDVLNTIEGQPELAKAFKNGKHPDTTIMFNPDKLQSKQQLTDIYNQAHAPTDRVSKVANSIEAKAVKDRLVNAGFDEKAGFTTKTVEDQSNKIANIIKNNPQDISDIANGVKELPSEVNSGMFITEAEKFARDTNNPQLIADLAKSKIVSGTSDAAQTMRFLQERDPNGPVKLVNKANKQLEDSLPTKKMAKQAETHVKDMTDEVKKVKITKTHWDKFLEDIKC